MMNKCKPCLTIRMVYDSAVWHWKLFVQDVKDRSRINMYACEISVAGPVPSWQSLVPDHVKEIRKKAAASYTGSFFEINSNKLPDLIPEAEADKL